MFSCLCLGLIVVSSVCVYSSSSQWFPVCVCADVYLCFLLRLCGVSLRLVVVVPMYVFLWRVCCLGCFALVLSGPCRLRLVVVVWARLGCEECCVCAVWCVFSVRNSNRFSMYVSNAMRVLEKQG